jgi:hypothetical protein
MADRFGEIPVLALDGRVALSGLGIRPALHCLRAICYSDAQLEHTDCSRRGAWQSRGQNSASARGPRILKKTPAGRNFARLEALDISLANVPEHSGGMRGFPALSPFR